MTGGSIGLTLTWPEPSRMQISVCSRYLPVVACPSFIQKEGASGLGNIQSHLDWQRTWRGSGRGVRVSNRAVCCLSIRKCCEHDPLLNFPAERHLSLFIMAITASNNIYIEGLCKSFPESLSREDQEIVQTIDNSPSIFVSKTKWLISNGLSCDLTDIGRWQPWINNVRSKGKTNQCIEFQSWSITLQIRNQWTIAMGHFVNQSGAVSIMSTINQLSTTNERLMFSTHSMHH